MVQSALLALTAATGWLNIPLLGCLAFIHGTIHAFSVPAAYGLLPRAVEPKNLSSAIAFSSSYRTLALFAGPALAGVLIANFPIAVSFLTNALAYALYLVVLKKLRLPPLEKPLTTKAPGMRGYWRDFLDGLHYALRHPLIGMLLLVGFFNDGLRRLTGSLLPVFADRLFSHGPHGLAILAGASGIGAAAAALLLSRRRDVSQSLRIILWGFAMTIVTTVGFVLSTSSQSAVVSRLVFGLAGEAVLTSATILLQSQVDDGYRSRVMGNAFLISQMASLSLVATGPLSSLFGLDQMINGFAAMACVALAAFWFYFGRKRQA
jgi:MFS family permease